MPKVTQFTLGQHLDITEVEKVHKNLLHALEKSNEVLLIGSNVERADSAGLQLLVSLNKTLSKSSGAITWQDPSEPLVRSIAQLDLKNDLNMASS